MAFNWKEIRGSSSGLWKLDVFPKDRTEQDSASTLVLHVASDPHAHNVLVFTGRLIHKVLHVTDDLFDLKVAQTDSSSVEF